MKVSCAVLIAVALSTLKTPAQGTPMPPPIVFFDIAGPEGAKQAAFYRDVFGWESGPGGALSVPIWTGCCRRISH